MRPNLHLIMGHCTHYERLQHQAPRLNDDDLADAHAELVEVLNDPTTSDRVFEVARDAVIAVERELGQRARGGRRR